jgi:hypothetical protein
MRRVEFIVVVQGPSGGSKERLLKTLAEGGYTVSLPKVVGPGRIEVKVAVPYGEVNR